MRILNFWIVLMFAAPGYAVADTYNVVVHLKNNVSSVAGRPQKEGLRVILDASMLFYNTSELSGLRIPINFGHGQFTPHIELSVTNNTHSEVPLYQALDDPAAMGILSFDVPQRVSFPVYGECYVSSPGRYQLVAQLEAMDEKGKRIYIKSRPLEFQVVNEANQSKDPTP